MNNEQGRLGYRDTGRRKTYPDSTGTAALAGLSCAASRLLLAVGLAPPSGSSASFTARGRGAMLSFPCGRISADPPRDDPAPSTSPPPSPNTNASMVHVSIARVASHPATQGTYKRKQKSKTYPRGTLRRRQRPPPPFRRGPQAPTMPPAPPATVIGRKGAGWRSEAPPTSRWDG